MRCPVNAIKSLNEIIRVAKEGAALMLIVDGKMVGTTGLMKVEWWYGDGEFMTERWNFVLPSFHHTPASKALRDEATAIAALAGLDLIPPPRFRPSKAGTS